MWKVYLLRSSKKRWYYVGSTKDLDRRIKEHNKGLVGSTKFHTPLTLVYEKSCVGEKEARVLEKRIKEQRLLKEQIIRSIER